MPLVRGSGKYIKKMYFCAFEISNQKRYDLFRQFSDIFPETQ